KKESFWLYRSAEKGLGAADKQPKVDASYAAIVRRVSRGKQEVCPQDPALRKASAVTVQASETERFAFKRVAVDGCYLWVYADHIRFLKKIRTRVNGKQVQGYSAKGVNIAVDGRVEVCPQKALNNKDKMLSVQAAETRYTSDVLASMSPQDILTAAKNTLIQINATHSYGMTAHNIMLSHGGRNLVSVPVENMAGCLTDLDKLLVIARTGEVLP
ncbi:hypothetical protein ACW3ST_005088, partial [Salmonella enterica subsp. salamae serovar 42:b:e,n,x,z15]